MEKVGQLINEKIKQADENADMRWVIEADEYAAWYATTHRFLTSDDILIWLDDRGYRTHNNSALGGVFRRLANAGTIAPAGYKPSIRASRHKAPIRVWKSLIYEGDNQ